MLDFRFYPTTVSAKVGDVIEFIDRGGNHNATLVQGSCATPTLSPGGHASLTIRQVGAYPPGARSTSGWKDPSWSPMYPVIRQACGTAAVREDVDVRWS